MNDQIKPAASAAQKLILAAPCSEAGRRAFMLVRDALRACEALGLACGSASSTMWSLE